MSDLTELRYPFENALEFFRSYAMDRAAFHLDFAWIAASLLALRVLVGQRDLGQKLLALYFGLTPFNNFAFQILPGSSIGDVFGVACVGYYAVALKHRFGWKMTKSPVGFALFTGATVMSAHAIIIGLMYPQLNAGDAGVLRVLVIGKIFVLAACCCLFDEEFRRESDVRWLIRAVVSFATIGLVTYILQGCLLFSGTVPYGTYLDAGYVGFPTFGSISIERGHFGKFLTPLFPLFLFGALKQRRFLVFALFILVTIVNFSASSLSFMAAYVCVSLLYFRARLARPKAMMAMACAACLFAAFVVYTWDLWLAVGEKIYQLAIEGDSEGGRGWGTFVSYIEAYPFGTSYGGSSLRTAPGLEEINSGIFTFVSQTSVLSAGLIAGFLALVWWALGRAGRIANGRVRATLKIGIVVVPFIFATDILWFVPTIWLPFLLASKFPRRRAKEPCSSPATVGRTHSHAAAEQLTGVSAAVGRLA